MPLKFPEIYLLCVKYEDRLPELRALERDLDVVFNINEAQLVLGDVTTKGRANFELRKLGVWTTDVTDLVEEGVSSGKDLLPVRKRRKVVNIPEGKVVINLDSSTDSGTESESDQRRRKTPLRVQPLESSSPRYEEGLGSTKLGDSIEVLNLNWYNDSVREGKLLSHKPYLVYKGKIIPKPKSEARPAKGESPTKIFARAKADPQSTPPPTGFRRHHRGISEIHSQVSQGRPHLLPQETTAEHEYVENLPPVPEYLTPGSYACQRPTPLHPPNEAFIAQLRMIKKKREYMGETEAGYAYYSRSYEGAIATIAAYPHTLTSAHELIKLPHCGTRFAALFHEWKETGMTKEVEDLATDEKFQSIDIFMGIFGVGDKTAREFYAKGWREMDDIIEFAWDSLTAEQMIGTKFYDDFQKRIPRPEAEKIAKHVLSEARKIHPGFEMVICGGYRKGKPDCGDVDIVLSNREESATSNFLYEFLLDLTDEGSVTHTLRWTMRNSERGQTPVTPVKVRAGGGFDTLDHAFVVWQDQDWPTKEADLAADPKYKNPNPHRRVDIIISPWKTAGCAILAWSSGTYFGRDLRSYCRKEKGWKFDSSGITTLDDGTWVDLEKGDEAGDMVEKEKRVFEGLGLVWREPTERCTD
jgi:DNA polymerase IV